MFCELNGDEIDQVRGGESQDVSAELIEAADDLLLAISCADIDDERVEDKAQALAVIVATIRNTR